MSHGPNTQSVQPCAATGVAGDARRAQMRVRNLVTLLTITACAGALNAQTVRLELRDSATNSAVVGALVSASDSLGRQRADGLSNDRGMVTFRLPSAGLWSFGIRRIGITPQKVAGIRVESGAVVALPLRMTSARQTLSQVRVTAEGGICGRAPEGENRTAMLWEQITLALRASTLSRADSTATLARVQERARELSPSLEELSSQLLRDGNGVGRAFLALDPDSLASVGYVRKELNGDFSFFAPDEMVLLSEAFLGTHCFDTPKRDANPALAELQFRPVRGRSVPDVEGTAFVDAESGELQRIEFRYVFSRRLIPVSAPHAGGYVVLSRLQSGLWIVADWAIRMPRFAFLPARAEYRLTGYREVGGTVTPLWNPRP